MIESRKNKRVLIACEKSQTVTIEMRKLGIEAFSCDIDPCMGGHPEWHIWRDVTNVLNEDWSMIIAFPPCTHLAASGAAWFKDKRVNGKQQRGINFFMMFVRHKCKKIAIENPVGIMSSIWRTPNQIIQPYEFGDSYQKTTCLWLKGLPHLVPTKFVDKGERIVFSTGKSNPKWFFDALSLPSKKRSEIRSKTFPGIAKAMAEQWGEWV